MGLQDIWTLVEADWPLLTWNHVCGSFQNKTATLRMVSNGEVILDKVLGQLLETPMAIPPAFLETLSLMRNAGTNQTIYESAIGKVTDVNIWNHSMSTEEMKNWTNCTTNYTEERGMENDSKIRGLI